MASDTVHATWVLAGLKDAIQWRRVKDVVSSDIEIRAHLTKSFLLNSLALLSIFVFDLILMPILHRKASPGSIASTSGLYQLLWVFPVVGGSLYLNGIWCSKISERMYTVEHGAGHGPSAKYVRTVASSVDRAVFIAICITVSYVLLYIPWIGSIISFVFTCWVDSYYCFEFVWLARGLSLRERLKFLEDRWAYFLGFGLPTTAVCFAGTSLLNTAVFALIFPSYIVLAMYANPIPSRSHSSGSNVAGDPYMQAEPSTGYIPTRLPIFSLILQVHSALMRAIQALITGSRERSGRVKLTKESYEDGGEDGELFALPMRDQRAGFSRRAGRFHSD